ncbi:MAG: hypothetical protein ABSG37_11040 [Candidatus Limnocylindrales bacterium]|jgi:hypothetical protein
MALGTSSPGFDPEDPNPLGQDAPIGDRRETIELIGPHLRVRGEISLHMFNRLSDLINFSSGYVRLKDAQLLRRNGDPTDLVVPELMVNQDEITFIAQRAESAGSAPSQGAASFDWPLRERTHRQFVAFTSGHTLIGTIYVFPDTDIADFVDTPDPRFIPLTTVTARSLADRRVISHFAFVLVNRTQMTAATFLEAAGQAIETGVVLE